MTAIADTHRMAETGEDTGSVRSMGSGGALQAQSPELPKPLLPTPRS